MTECPFCGSPPSEIRNADFDHSFECGTGFREDDGEYRSQECYERQIESLEAMVAKRDTAILRLCDNLFSRDMTIRKLQQGECR